jgi:hypothetical protein
VKRRSVLGLVTGIALAATGCGPGAVGDEVVGVLGAPIAGGELDSADLAVVGFYNVGAQSLCSGTLIAPNVVLTARHCVSPTLDTASNGGILCSETRSGPLALPSSFLVTTSAEINYANAGEYLVSEVIGLPTAEPDGSDLFCGRDVALLVLKGGMDPAVVAPVTPRVDAPLTVGEEYSAVGYGATDDDGSGAGFRRRRDALFVECVGEACPGAIEATEWGGDTGVCHGDSGGPALDLEGHVTGVTSRGSAGCSNPVYGDVYENRQWLKDSVAYASGVGEYPAPAWTEGTTVDPGASAPVGATCAAAADCYTGLCVTRPEGSYCTRTCTEAAPCPPGYHCAAGATAGEPPRCEAPRDPAPAIRSAPPPESGCMTTPGASTGRPRMPLAALVGLLLLAAGRVRVRRARVPNPVERL